VVEGEPGQCGASDELIIEFFDYATEGEVGGVVVIVEEICDGGTRMRGKEGGGEEDFGAAVFGIVVDCGCDGVIELLEEDWYGF